MARKNEPNGLICTAPNPDRHSDARKDVLTLTRRLKADPVYQHVPLLVLTSFAMKSDDQKTLAAGCDAYILNPVDTRKLSEQIASVTANPPEARGW